MSTVSPMRVHATKIVVKYCTLERVKENGISAVQPDLIAFAAENIYNVMEFKMSC